ncbi:inorganic phosphate transporter [Streptomyces sp. SID13666]|uniref:inorganic phosphate transporter n=1 Tax=unclassified Streptomyces TaxID=2593676 RepID=UPI0013C247D7|nr:MULTISPECIES: inorganic phosphate transporter [unclassified Streptomyces]NEA57028.1 inorganic phosphate transporter [Streptomyces sp. SID13666]NEA76935.1 inorganic phosphate transporter [Streptomyces sp. SID13588]
MEHITLLIGIVIVTALVFDFTNGFHDTANAMATTISTGALKPKTAVAMSAVLNLLGAFLSVEVAKTISGGIIDESAGIRPEVIFAGLVGAIVWNMLTWLAGLPSSSSHALFGGLIGATLVSVGAHGVNGDKVVMKVLIPALAAPVVAGLAAMLATKLTYRIGRNSDPKATAKGYRAGQIASAGLVSLAHGTNDAQKTMGVITLALITGGVVAPHADPPMWVIVSAGTAIALGTYLGGWRIIRTMGKGLTDIEAPQGFAAQTGAAATILASSHLGFALSTTQVCSGSVMGSGVGRKGAVVRWSTAGRMVAAWGLTLPAAGLVAAGAALLADQGTWGIAGVAVLALAACTVIWLASRRKPIDHSNVNELPVESQGAVTAAIAAVSPPPAGPVAPLAATIPAPAAVASPADAAPATA